MHLVAASRLLLGLGLLAAAPRLPGAPGPAVQPETLGFSVERLERVAQAMQRRIDAGELPGAIIAVSRDTHVVHFKTLGVMDVEAQKAMTPDAVFRLASMTKPVIAVAILMLVEEGRLRLHDPVSRYIPELKQLSVAVRSADSAAAAGGAILFTTEPAKREITVRDLLTHVSGMVSGPIGLQELMKNPRRPDETLATYIPRLAAFPLEFQPGTRWSYSPGAGFEVLGRVIEVVAGVTLERFFQERIFQPLGMKDTFFGPAANPARVAHVYGRKGNAYDKQPVTDSRFLPGNRFFSGAGGLSGTAADYLRFAQMLANGGELDGRRLLAPRTVALLGAAHVADTFPGRTPGTGFGLGVSVITDRGAAGTLRANGSYGWGGAAGTHFWVDPKTKLVGLLMIQIPGNYTDIRSDFESTVMQALLEDAGG